MKTCPDVSIIIPTFRESQNLRELTSRLFTALSGSGWLPELIVVDDNSDDGTLELCQELAQEFPLRLITRSDTRGLATAVVRGMEESRGHRLVVMDADLSHPPEAVPALLAALDSADTDFVIGSRYVDGGAVDESWSLFRHVNSRIATGLARGLTCAKDPMAGFFALHRSAVANLNTLNPCGYKIGLELLVRCRCRRVVEVPISFQDRLAGESKLTWRQQWLYVRHLIRLYLFAYPDVVRFITFAAIGASGVVVDLVCLKTLVPVTGLAMARAIGIWSAMTWNFEWNRRITFAEPEQSEAVSEYHRFCTACAFGAMLSWLTSLTLVHSLTAFQARPAAAALIGIGCGSIANYVFCLRWVFRRKCDQAADGRLSESPLPSLRRNAA